MRGEIDRYRESVEERFFSTPHLHLAYLHVKLLADCSLGVFASSDEQIVEGAMSIVRALISAQTLATPLVHHYAAMAVTTLIATIDRDPTTSGALLELRNFLDTLHLRRQPTVVRPAWHTAIMVRLILQLLFRHSVACHVFYFCKSGNAVIRYADSRALESHHCKTRSRRTTASCGRSCWVR